MDIRKIKKLIELLEESGIAELEIKEGEESVRISRQSSALAQVAPMAPVMTAAAPPPVPVAAADAPPAAAAAAAAAAAGSTPAAPAPSPWE